MYVRPVEPSPTEASNDADVGHSAERTEEFVPIEDYTVLGDGRTVALVARDGAIDWFPVPRIDAPPVFAALLDPGRGGRFALTPEGPATATRRYLPETNVAETVYTCARGSVRVVDALTLGTAGPPPWTELVRRVEGLTGEVAMTWELTPGERFDRRVPVISTHGGAPTVRLGDQNLAVVTEHAGTPCRDGTGLSARFTVRAGESALVGMTATDDEPLHVPRPEHMAERSDRTVEFWRQVASRVRYTGPHMDAVVRSALVLRMLLYSGTGAMAAAATTSLPEAVGGRANYDYRYAWVRDSSFAMDALVRLGMWEEAHACLSFLLSAVAGGELAPFYGLDGDSPGRQVELDLRGYRDSPPVRSGNGANDQLQLGNYGDLLDAVWHATRGGAVLDPGSAELVARLADEVCDRWREPDAGIWELPRQRHYTISKIGCWVALDRASRMAEAGHLDAKPRWAEERETVRAWIDRHCWSESKQAFTFHTGTEELDAAVLLAARTGFLDGDDPRLAATVRAVRAELGSGPFLYRYSGMVGREGAFVACSFWLVDALVAIGDTAEARRIMDEVIAAGNDVGLFAEEIDVVSGGMRGNLPQALSHLGLIIAATTVYPYEQEA